MTRDGMVSVGGNLYSVPDTTRRRAVEVHTLAHEVRIFEEGRLVAAHPVLEGHGGRRLAAGHRAAPRAAVRQPANARIGAPIPSRPGDQVARRPLAIYAAVGERLAAGASTATEEVPA